MIGFKMKAWGSGGFKQQRSAWNEGSLMSLKILLTIAGQVNKDKLSGSQKNMVSAIESSFKQIADNKFSHICSFGLSFALFMQGDIKFKYYFESGKDASQIQSELYKLFLSQMDEVGDQVMIYFCAIVDDFMTTNFNNTEEDLVLTIDVDL